MLAFTVTQYSLLNITITSATSVQNAQANCNVQTEAVTVSATSAYAIACMCTDHGVKTNLVTITATPLSSMIRFLMNVPAQPKTS